MGVLHYIWNNRKGVLSSLAILLMIGIILMVVNVSNTSNLVGTVFFSLGTSFSAGAIVSFFDLLRETGELLATQSVKDIISSGLSRIYNHRDIDEYYSLIDGAHQIDVAGYSLRSFIQSHKETIISLSKNDGFRMRIVLVNPESIISTNREYLENGVNNGVYKANVEMICDLFKDISNIEIYLIDYALSTAIFRIDNSIFVGPHFIKSASKSTITMKYNANTWGFDEYTSEFEAMCKAGIRYNVPLKNKE